MATGYAGLPNEVVRAASGVEYAYRDTRGDGVVPLILLQLARFLGLAATPADCSLHDSGRRLGW